MSQLDHRRLLLALCQAQEFLAHLERLVEWSAHKIIVPQTNKCLGEGGRIIEMLTKGARAAVGALDNSRGKPLGRLESLPQNEA